MRQSSVVGPASLEALPAAALEFVATALRVLSRLHRTNKFRAVLCIFRFVRIFPLLQLYL